MTDAMIPHMTPSTGSPNEDAPVAARTLVPPAFAVVEAVPVAAAWALRADLQARRACIFFLAEAAFRFDSAFFFAFAALPALSAAPPAFGFAGFRGAALAASASPIPPGLPDAVFAAPCGAVGPSPALPLAAEVPPLAALLRACLA